MQPCILDSFCLCRRPLAENVSHFAIFVTVQHGNGLLLRQGRVLHKYNSAHAAMQLVAAHGTHRLQVTIHTPHISSTFVTVQTCRRTVGNLLRSSPGIDSQPGGIDSLESIPGLLERLQIRAPDPTGCVLGVYCTPPHISPQPFFHSYNPC